MSCLSLGKKLPPPKKAWEGFTSKLQRKLHKIKRSKAIKKTTSHFNTTLAAVLNRSQSFPSFLLQRMPKRRVITRSSASTLRLRPHKHYYKHHSYKQKFSPVYVDDLFTTEPISIQAPTAAAVTGKVIEKPPESSTAAKTLQQLTTAAETSKTVVEMQQLSGVDERAEEFIVKFKEEMRQEEMRLQRQRSFGEYQEMLARGL